MKGLTARGGVFARVFGGAVVSQALLSATNLLIGLILIRRVPQAQYGAYVLIATAVPLLSQLQSSIITPLLTSRVTAAGGPERRDFIGGLFREQKHALAILALVSVLICAVCWLSGALSSNNALILSLGLLAALAWLYRDLSRTILVSFRRSYDVLRADTVFAVVFTTGTWMATYLQTAAAFAALAMAVAALVGGWLLSRALWLHDPWHPSGTQGAFQQCLRLGVWSSAGSITHWLFSQGYTYIVAARLDVSAVAAIAATRLLLSPLGVFSLGITTVMFSTSTLWLKHHGPRGLLRRVLLFTIVMSVVSVAYIAVIWWLRGWIFAYVLKRDFQQRDLLLTLWSLIFLCTVIRDQIIFLLIAKEQYKRLANLVFVCALIGLAVSFFGIQYYGAAGGLMGLLCGECVHVAGVLVLTFHDLQRRGMAVNRAGT